MLQKGEDCGLRGFGLPGIIKHQKQQTTKQTRYNQHSVKSANIGWLAGVCGESNDEPHRAWDLLGVASARAAPSQP